jgi:hypothetical protein
MQKLKEMIRSPHIQIALATGICIIVMAYFSKRILPEPIGYLPLAIPPFIATIYEYVLKRYENSKISTTWYWIVLIFFCTFLVIFLSSCRQSSKSINVDTYLLPNGFRIPHDVSSYYEEHQNLLDSLIALNSDLRNEPPVIRKLNKPLPQKYEPLNLNGDTLSLIYEGGRMDGQEREEEYKILLDGEKVFEFSSRAPIPIDHIHGFFVWEGDWILEYYNTIIISGVNLNKKHGYDASYFVSVIGSNLLYFAKKDNRIYLVENQNLTDYYYYDVVAYQCCDYTRFNPTFSKNILTFYARRDKNTYFVQAYYSNQR